MASITWKSGTSGDWSVGASWSTGIVPGMLDDAVIGVAGAYTVTMSSQQSVKSLALNAAGATVSVTSTLNLGGMLSVDAGTLLLTSSGVISGGKVRDTGGGLAFNGNAILKGVTYQGVLDMSQAHASLTIANGITLTGLAGTGTGTINLTGYNAQLHLSGPTTLDNATLNIGQQDAYSQVVGDDIGAGAVVTLGTKLAVVHTGRLASFIANGGNPATAVVNKGLVTAAFSGGALNFGALTFTNAGTILASNADTVVFNANTIANTGTIAVTTGGGAVFNGAWSNAGKISMVDAGLGLNGSFNTTALNSITRSGGVVSIGGALDNSLGTINVGATTALGTLLLTSSGVISGGKVRDTGGGLAFNGNAILKGVTYQGVLDMSQAHASLTIANGITLTGLAGTGTGTINLTGYNAQLHLSGPTTLDNATLNIGQQDAYSQVVGDDIGAGAVVTLGTKLAVVHTGRLASFIANGGNPATAVVNKGLITAAFSGGVLNFGAITFTNTGTIQVSNADSVFVNAGTVSNLVGGTFTGGTYRVEANSLLRLSHNAPILTNNADITLSGIGSAFQFLNPSNGQAVALDATLNTIGASGALHLADGRVFSATGPFTNQGLLELRGGTFQTTSLNTAAGSTLTGFGTLDGPLAHAGTLTAVGGLLKLNGAISGTGGLIIDDGATLELGSNPAAGQVVRFDGLDATLRLDTPAGFAATIDRFAPGARLSLAGVGLATKATLTSTTLSVTLAGGSLLTYALTSPTSSNLAIASDGAGGSVITAYGRARASAHTPAPVTFTNRHVGDAALRLLTISNTGTTNAFWENLDASIGGATAGITASGAFAGLAPGATNKTALKVGLDTATAGAKTGTAKISLYSNGTGISGFGKTALAGQTVQVSGNVYAYAAPTLSATTLNFGAARIGGSLAKQDLLIGNGTTVTPFQESLSYALAPLPAGFSALAGGSGIVTAGTQATATLAIAADKAGDFSGATATLALTSTGVGTSGLADTKLASQTITLNGRVYAPALAQLSTKTVNFGVVHVGDVVDIPIGITNIATGALTDTLTGGFGAITAPFIGSGSLPGLAAGASGALKLGLNTTNAGAFAGSAQLALKSSNPELAAVAVAAGPITLSGTVNAYAQGRFTQLSGGGTFGQSGTSYTLSLGTIASTNLPLTIDLGLLNAVTGAADALSGQFEIAGSAGFLNAGFVAFADLAPGTQRTGLSVALQSKLASGTYSETITLHSASTNASGSTTLADQTLTISATVLVATQLTRTPTTIVGGTGADTYIATSGVLYSGHSINGGGGVNTLLLQGAGIFDLRAPTVLRNIGVLNAMEGQPGTMLDDGTVVPSRVQTVYLRDGLNLTMNVAPSSAMNAANPLPATIVIHGANSASVINLADGNDIVFVGGVFEKYYGGGGYNTFNVTGSTIGATINGGDSGTSALFVRGGGTATMGNNITNIAAVTLTNPSAGIVQPDYVFRANTLANLLIRASAGTDTITVGNATQRVLTSGGTTTVRATAALGGVTVVGGAGQTTLEITTSGLVTLAAATDRVTVKLNAAAQLTLNKMAFIHAIGSAGTDTIKAGAAGQTVTGGAGTDILHSAAGFGVTFRDNAAGLHGDTIKGFGGADAIRITDLIAGSASLNYAGNALGGTLTVSDGARAASITMTGSYTQGLFHLASDGAGGSSITYG